MTKERSPFTWAGSSLSFVTDFATTAATYLQKLRDADNLEQRMLAHADFVKMNMEILKARTKKLNIMLEATDTLVGASLQMFRHHQQLKDMMQNQEATKAAADKGPLEHRVDVIERLLNERLEQIEKKVP